MLGKQQALTDRCGRQQALTDGSLHLRVCGPPRCERPPVSLGRLHRHLPAQPGAYAGSRQPPACTCHVLVEGTTETAHAQGRKSTLRCVLGLKCKRAGGVTFRVYALNVDNATGNEYRREVHRTVWALVLTEGARR